MPTPPPTKATLINMIKAVPGTPVGSVFRVADTDGELEAVSVSGGDVVKLDTQTPSSGDTDITFSAISGAYSHLRIAYRLRGLINADTAAMYVEFNADGTAANYWESRYVIAAAGGLISGPVSPSTDAVAFAGNLPGAISFADHYGTGIIEIPFYAAAVGGKTFNVYGQYATDVHIQSIEVHGGWKTANAPITSVRLRIPSGSPGGLAGNCQAILYGVK